MKIQKIENVEILYADDKKVLIRKSDFQNGVVNNENIVKKVWLAKSEKSNDWLEIDENLNENIDIKDEEK